MKAPKPSAPAPAGTPPAPTLARQQQDFTGEGSPPPGCVGKTPPRQPGPAAPPPPRKPS